MCAVTVVHCENAHGFCLDKDPVLAAEPGADGQPGVNTTSQFYANRSKGVMAMMLTQQMPSQV